jgi:hypothetical protein
VEDYRLVPVEVLRDFARTRSEETSIRAAADEVGVSHSAFHKFMLGQTNPQPRVRRLLALWYARIVTYSLLDNSIPASQVSLAPCTMPVPLTVLG